MRTWTLIGVFIGVLIIAFAIFIARIEEGPAPVVNDSSDTGAAITNIHFTDSYKKGVHTLKGTAIVPTACTALSATASIPEASTTPTIRVDLSAATDDGLCLQLPTDATFSTTVESDEADLPIEIYTNGTLATSTP